jgi:hypothetical protein
MWTIFGSLGPRNIGWPTNRTSAHACQRTACGLRYVVVFDPDGGLVASGVIQHGRLVRRNK